MGGLLCVHTSPAMVSRITSHYVLGDIIQPASSVAADMITRTGACFIPPHINTLWLVYNTSVSQSPTVARKGATAATALCLVFYYFFMGMHEVLQAQNVFKYFRSWERKRRQIISPYGWKYKERGGIYHWSDHKEAAPNHFAQSRSRKHTSSV